MKKSIIFAVLILLFTIGWFASGQIGKVSAQDEKKATKATGGNAPVTLTPEQMKSFMKYGQDYSKYSKYFRKIVFNCWKYIESGIERGGSADLISTEYLVKNVLSKESDLWVSADKGGMVRGCFIIGAAPYPESTGIVAETIGGEFDFKVITPIVEKYYKNLRF